MTITTKVISGILGVYVGMLVLDELDYDILIEREIYLYAFIRHPYLYIKYGGQKISKKLLLKNFH